jgi:hypothetical protein
LFADRGGRPCQPCMRLGHDCHVSHGQLQWPTALLLCNKPCNICGRMIILTLSHHKIPVYTYFLNYLKWGDTFTGSADVGLDACCKSN